MGNFLDKKRYRKVFFVTIRKNNTFFYDDGKKFKFTHNNPFIQ